MERTWLRTVASDTTPSRAMVRTLCLGGEVLAAVGSGPQVGLPMTGATISLWLLLLDLFLLTAGAGLVRATYVMRSGANSDENAGHRVGRHTKGLP
jgi:hypothetical protein